MRGGDEDLSTIALAKLDHRFHLPAGRQVERKQRPVVEKILRSRACGMAYGKSNLIEARHGFRG